MPKQLPLRQCLGIDVSKDSLQVHVSNLEVGQRLRTIASTRFANTSKGLEQLRTWIGRHRVKEVDFHVVLEATGVYHENAAYFLHELGLYVSVVLPNQSKHFAKSLKVRSKTDVIDAGILAQMGLERTLQRWQPAKASLRRLKRLCRERSALQQQKTVALNHQHAFACSYKAEKDALQRTQKLIRFLEKLIEQVEQQIQTTLQADEALSKKVEKICRFKGLGTLTVVTIISETDGFALFRKKGQVVCFAGYDVRQNESGTSLKGKSRISKKGNRHIRKALYLPALCAVKYEPHFQNLYQRVLQNTSVKMKAYVAVQRKILVLIYTLYKNDAAYDPAYPGQNAHELTQKNRQELCPA